MTDRMDYDDDDEEEECVCMFLPPPFDFVELEASGGLALSVRPVYIAPFTCSSGARRWRFSASLVSISTVLPDSPCEITRTLLELELLQS